MQPIKTSICAIAAAPEQFDGKIVSIRAKVVSGFEVFAVRSPDQDCHGMWLTYSEGGPTASTSINVARPVRDPVALIKDQEFRRFQKFLKAEMYPRSRKTMCIACTRYELLATMVGRVDYAGKGKPGYGHLNAFKLQFEMISVSEVSANDLSSTYDPKKYSTRPVRFPTGYITGRLIAPDGKAYEDVSVMATPADAETETEGSEDSDTDKRGRFKIGVPPGEYVVGVGIIDPISQSFPFRKTFAPAAISFHEATVLRVRDGERVRADIHLPMPLAPKSIPVSVQWPDGRPVENANVWLTEVSDGAGIVVNTAVSHTGADGKFALHGVDQTDYFVHANIYVKPGYKKFCASNVTVSANEAPELIKLVLDQQENECGN